MRILSRCERSPKKRKMFIFVNWHRRVSARKVRRYWRERGVLGYSGLDKGCAVRGTGFSILEACQFWLRRGVWSGLREEYWPVWIACLPLFRRMHQRYLDMVVILLKRFAKEFLGLVTAKGTEYALSKDLMDKLVAVLWQQQSHQISKRGRNSSTWYLILAGITTPSHQTGDSLEDV